MKEHIVTKWERKELYHKLRYTAGILLIYMLGRKVPLYGISVNLYREERLGAAELLVQAIGGESNQISLFSLGISPYIMSLFMVQIFNIIKEAVTKSKASPKRTNRTTIVVTLLYSIIQAGVHTGQLDFTKTGVELLFYKCLVVLQMVTGVMFIVWLVERNKKCGLGERTVIIYINIMAGIISTMAYQKISILIMPVIIGILLMVVMIVMDNAEMRIPVQRISIHSIYADKNYQAIKLSPMGVMPIMFSTAAFRLPQLILTLLHGVFPEHEGIAWWNANMAMTKPLGIVVYLVIIYILTIGFSILFLSPWDLSEQFLKNGDSIVNLHAGKDTKRYLVRVVLSISFFSATIMGVCVGIPLFLQFYGNLDSALMMLPTSFMMLSGIWCSLYREFKTIQGNDSYRPFI